jgi:hypothetical protein
MESEAATAAPVEELPPATPNGEGATEDSTPEPPSGNGQGPDE